MKQDMFGQKEEAKQKIAITIGMSLVLLVALSSFSPAAFSQPQPNATAKEITVITPEGDELDFIATPQQLQQVLTRIINNILGGTAPEGTTPAGGGGGGEENIQDNVEAAVNATFAASDAVEASVGTTPSGIFGLPIPIEACAEVLGARFCL